ncbi:Glutamate receptor 1.4 [Abeliophyllum distichum]|uniref:Glutamate receptor 1.4 n=1 Tax=Abeliophyllum distichum TaxID=126358 RepID=A0ABD1Q4J4_9LAMI
MIWAFAQPNKPSNLRLWLKSYKTPEEYDRALREGSKNGGVDAIIEEIPYLKLFLAVYPHEYTMIDSSETTNGFGFAFPKGSPLVQEMSSEIAKLREEGILLEIEKKWFRSQTSPLSLDTEPPTTKTLDINNFSRLFLIYAICELVALLLFLVFVLCEKMSIKNYILRKLAGGKLLSIFRYLFPRMANTVGGINAR